MYKISVQCKKLLLEKNIKLSSSIDFNINNEVHTLSFEYIIDTYMQASNESQLVFLVALQKAINTKNMGINKFFEGMGQLLFMTHLSKKIKI